MAFDVRVQNVLEKKPQSDSLWCGHWVKKPGLTDRGVATGVTKFRMASGGLNFFKREIKQTLSKQHSNLHETGAKIC